MNHSEVPSRRNALRGTLAVGALAAAPALAQAPAHADSRAPAYRNPLVEQRADPHINRHTDGHYYFTATSPEYGRIILRRSRTLRGLTRADESVIWRRHTSGDMASHIWAPELHHINGKWYI